MPGAERLAIVKYTNITGSYCVWVILKIMFSGFLSFNASDPSFLTLVLCLENLYLPTPSTRPLFFSITFVSYILPLWLSFCPVLIAIYNSRIHQTLWPTGCMKALTQKKIIEKHTVLKQSDSSLHSGRLFTISRNCAYPG